MGVQVLAAGAAGTAVVRAQKVPVGSGWFQLVLQLPLPGTAGPCSQTGSTSVQVY